MGRQWLHAKRAIVNLKKGQAVGKLVKELSIAAKLGGADPAGNARLFAAVEKARRDDRKRRTSRRSPNLARMPHTSLHSKVTVCPQLGAGRPKRLQPWVSQRRKTTAPMHPAMA
jgi:hypothetical protein